MVDRIRHSTPLITLALVVVLAATACGGSDDGADSPTATTETVEEGEPVDGGQLTFAVEGESDGYNPVAHRWSISGNLIGSSVYETLALVTDDGGVEPWLAESLEPNEDGTEWTIVARPDITFHDGTTLDAEVIAANLTARQEGLLTSLATAPIESVAVIDEMTVEVTMNTPWLAWPHSLASQSGYIMSMTNVDDPTADPIGTGPFQWAEWTPDVRVVVDRYDDYWRDDRPHLDSIDFEIIVDEQSREQSLEAGDVDAILDQSPIGIAGFRDTDYTLIEESQSDTHVVMLNSAVPPFDDPIAREALILATDNQALVDTLNEGETEVASGPFASERWQADDTGYPEPDPERAAELVEQYEENTGEPLAFTLKAGAGPGNDDRMSLLSAQWSAVGMQPDQESVEQAGFIGQTVAGDYQAALFRNFGWADPDFNYLFWHSSTALGPGEISVNFTQTKNDELDAALEIGRGSDDPDERAEAYDDVQRILNDEYAYAWLFHSLWAIVSEPEVKGWTEAIARGFSRQDAKIFWGDLWIDA
jgi:ABC-type transport system substrate-binding protein